MQPFRKSENGGTEEQHVPRPLLIAALAAMVSIIKRQEGVLIAHCLVAFSIVKKQSSFDKYPNRPSTDVEKQEKEMEPIEVELVPAEQEWLIVP